MNCANCAFFEPAFEMSYDGECRKNPPVIDMRREDEWIGVFPEVTADLWCGGHKRRPTKRVLDGAESRRFYRLFLAVVCLFNRAASKASR